MYSVDFYLTNKPDSVPLTRQFAHLPKHGKGVVIPEGAGPCAWVKAEISKVADDCITLIGVHRRKESVAALEWHA